MATTPQSAVLTPHEADLIRLTRNTVQVAKNRLSSSSFSIANSRDAFELGFLWQALDALEDATFEVLNVAESYLACSSASAAMDVILKRAPEEVGA